MGEKSYPCEDSMFLGRQGDLANHLFSELKTVSRKHLQLIIAEGIWNVKMCSPVTNSDSTTFNGTKMEHEKLYPMISGEFKVSMSRSCEITLRVRETNEAVDS